MWQETEGCLQPIACEELKPQSKKPQTSESCLKLMNEVGSVFSPVESQDDCSLWKTKSQKTQLSVSRPVMSDSLWPHGLQPTRLLCAWNSSSKNTAVGSHFLLLGIFPTQGSNPSLLYCRQILDHLSQQGSPFQGLSCTKSMVECILMYKTDIISCPQRIYFWMGKERLSKNQINKQIHTLS